MTLMFQGDESNRQSFLRNEPANDEHADVLKTSHKTKQGNLQMVGMKAASGGTLRASSLQEAPSSKNTSSVAHSSSSVRGKQKIETQQ